MEHLLDKYIILLSSGELRKFKLATTLFAEPRVLILDNPFIGLDSDTREQLKELLKTITSHKKIQIILVLSKSDDIPEFITHIIEVKDKIVLPLPKTEEEMMNHKFINNKANELMKKTKINFYFQEYIKNPEVAVLMMIVDDNKNMNGAKRNNILNPELKYIGINSTFIGKNFVAYFSFSK